MSGHASEWLQHDQISPVVMRDAREEAASEAAASGEPQRVALWPGEFYVPADDADLAEFRSLLGLPAPVATLVITPRGADEGDGPDWAFFTDPRSTWADLDSPRRS